VSDVRLAHTMILGRRYKLAAGAGQKLGPRLVQDKIVLDRYGGLFQFTERKGELVELF
jgi:hypothetical protein